MDSCAHDWQPVEKPPAERAPWFKCAKCGAMGYARTTTWKRRKEWAPKVQPRRCGAKGCQATAVAHLSRRTPRGELQWRCRTHLPPLVL